MRFEKWLQVANSAVTFFLLGYFAHWAFVMISMEIRWHQWKWISNWSSEIGFGVPLLVAVLIGMRWRKIDWTSSKWRRVLGVGCLFFAYAPVSDLYRHGIVPHDIMVFNGVSETQADLNRRLFGNILGSHWVVATAVSFASWLFSHRWRWQLLLILPCVLLSAIPTYEMYLASVDNRRIMFLVRPWWQGVLALLAGVWLESARKTDTGRA